MTSLVLSYTRELLDREDITIDDDFFSAGGDSIVAMHLVGQLARRTGLRLRTSLLFANPVLRDFVVEAQLLRDKATQPSTPAQPLAAVLEAARAGNNADAP